MHIGRCWAGTSFTGVDGESLALPDAPEASAFDITEADIDEVMAACSGHPRAAIRALLIGQQFLEAALEEARKEASWGYVRGRPSRRFEVEHASGNLAVEIEGMHSEGAL